MPGLSDSKRWEVLPCSGEDERMLCAELGVAPLVARVLCARGIQNPEDAWAFLHPSLDRDWADPMDIPGMARAASRVEHAILKKERIAVFGDFDVDGMTSTCLLTQGLRRFGADVYPYIPHRFGEGYGLSHEALNRVINDCHPDLIVTVDNGISSGNEVKWLLGQGIDVVVTDHHEPGDLVPEGIPVTDPKLQPDSYSRELAGAGVALKLVCALGRTLGMPNLWRQYTDLAALGTVSDMMLLQGENRSLVANGINLMRQSLRPGIVALAASAGANLAMVHADDLPFTLIPRLNAAGRMGSTEVAFDLLISEDPAEAAILAGMLEETNSVRRDTEGKLSEIALARLAKTYHGERVIVLAGEGWHEGVKGIVASRVVSKYHVPTIIFTVSNGIARGSGRSVGSVDLFHAVEQCSEYLVRFGGHAGAVGVTCEVDRIDVFRQRLQMIMNELPEEEFMDKGEVAAVVSLSDLTLESIRDLDVLQPFGQGNKRPLFGLHGVFMQNRARVGYDNGHLRFFATDGTYTVPAIMFRTPDIERAYTCDGPVDLVVDAVNESWQGKTNPKLMVNDILYLDSVAQDGSGMAKVPLGATKTVNVQCDGGGSASDVRANMQRLSEAELARCIKEALIGSNELLPAQKEALSRLYNGRSTLCIMATGRGKSFIFHAHAAYVALAQNKASVFVYPLRALVSDQAFHLCENLGQIGINVRVLTGETSEGERREVYEGLCNGSVDVVLTTPEYLAIHTDAFARCGRIGFLVVDEAHHAGSRHAGGREAYGEFGRILRDLNNPVALAVTATASTPVSREICCLLNIDSRDVIIDGTMRENLRLVDCRNMRERDAKLVSLVAKEKKTVVYVNSRDRASALARTLREGAPDIGHRISYYHAGLSRDVRRRIEKAFRNDQLCCIVSTSAFGEGVNLPGIRNVVLYHMPFGSTEFNQMSGRAGRDGREASIYLMYGMRDVALNERILQAQAPTRNDLAVLYRTLMTEDRRWHGSEFLLNESQLLAQAMQIDNSAHLTEDAIAAGVAVFEELGFCTTGGFAESRHIHMTHFSGRVDLSVSLRYTEGTHAIQEFALFKDWALKSLPQEMLGRLNKPIAPSFGYRVEGN